MHTHRHTQRHTHRHRHTNTHTHLVRWTYMYIHTFDKIDIILFFFFYLIHLPKEQVRDNEEIMVITPYGTLNINPNSKSELGRVVRIFGPWKGSIMDRAARAKGRVLAPCKWNSILLFGHEEDTLLIGLRGATRGHSNGENIATRGSRQSVQLRELTGSILLSLQQHSSWELLGPMAWLPNEPNLTHTTTSRLSKNNLKRWRGQRME